MKKKEKNTRKTIFLVSVIVVGFCLLLLILGPREKKSSKRGMSGWSGLKKQDSIQKTIIRSDIGKLDTLLVVVNSKDSIFEAISYSKKIKFLLDTTRDTKRAVLLDTTSGKKIRFIIKGRYWRGLYQKAFRKLERF